MAKYKNLPVQERNRIAHLVVRLGEETSKRQALEEQLQKRNQEIQQLKNMCQKLCEELEEERNLRLREQNKNQKISKEINQFQTMRQEFNKSKGQTLDFGANVSRRDQIDALKLQLNSSKTKQKVAPIMIEESSIAGNNSFFTQFDSHRKTERLHTKNTAKLRETNQHIKSIQEEWQEEVSKLAECKKRLKGLPSAQSLSPSKEDGKAKSQTLRLLEQRISLQKSIPHSKASPPTKPHPTAITYPTPLQKELNLLQLIDSLQT